MDSLDGAVDRRRAGSVVLDTPDPEGSKLAIYTNKQFLVNTQDVDVHAQVFAMGDVKLNAQNTNFYGSIASKKDAIFNAQEVDLYYKPVSTSLIEPIWALPGSRLAILYYNEQ